jgi:hypothetical protein
VQSVAVGSLLSLVLIVCCPVILTTVDASASDSLFTDKFYTNIIVYMSSSCFYCGVKEIVSKVYCIISSEQKM